MTTESDWSGHCDRGPCWMELGHGGPCEPGGTNDPRRRTGKDAPGIDGYGVFACACPRAGTPHVLSDCHASSPAEPCPNDHGTDGVIACWSPGGPCPTDRTVCGSCGPCIVCRPGEHPITSPASDGGDR